MTDKKFSFLEEQILAVLENSGLKELSEKNKATFLPQLATEAEYRLGLVLMQKLSEEQLKELVKLTEKGASQKELEKFWLTNINGFTEIVSKIMAEFAKDCQTILAKMVDK
ncbi:MAG: DUF5663 domain-containing protein [Candidatus Magasanikbacteria bacterium]|nr:DUF5663 domain-containing protein [Candidatus Magasanikbacteria bacterium]